MKHGLVFAMESEEAVVDAAVVPETQAEVEVAATEVTEQVGEIETMDTAVVDAEADAGTLGDIQEVMATSVDSGEGLTEEAAQIAEVAVESIRARLGMKRDQKVMPAMESFGSKSSRLTATKIAMEGVMETIKNIWESIIKALKWVWEKVKSFWLSLTKNRAQLLKHLEGLQTRVKSFTGEVGKTVTGGAVKGFSIDGKTNFSTAEKVISDSTGLLASIGKSSEFAKGTATKLLQGSSTDLDNAGNELFDKLVSDFSAIGEVKSAKAASSGKEVKHYGNLFNGKSVAISMDDNAAFSVQLDDNRGEAAKEGDALSKDQMEKLLVKAISLVKSLQGFDKIEKSLADISKACENVAKSIINGAADAESDKEKANALKKAAANVRALNSMIAKFGSSCPAAVFNAAKGAGDYVTASLSSAGKKEEKKEEKK